MTRRPGLLKLTCIAISVSQVLGGSALFGAEAPALRGLHNALGGTMTPAFVAQDLGLFSKHGLEHSLQYIPATTGVQALTAGSEEIGLVGNQVQEKHYVLARCCSAQASALNLPKDRFGGADN